MRVVILRNFWSSASDILFFQCFVVTTEITVDILRKKDFSQSDFKFNFNRQSFPRSFLRQIFRFSNVFLVNKEDSVQFRSITTLVLLFLAICFRSIFSKSGHTFSGNARFKSYDWKRKARFSPSTEIPYISNGNFLHPKNPQNWMFRATQWSKLAKFQYTYSQG